MKEKIMTRSGLKVTELSFGTLILGKLQANLEPHEGAKAIRRALELGVNFIDTAQSYGTYEHIRLALDGSDKGEIVIATKSHEKSYDRMDEAVRQALSDMNLRHIDIFHLHLVRSKDDMRSREGALKCLIEHRRKGTIKAIGASAHSAEGVMAISECDDIDVVFPVMNKKGLGIVSGTLQDMIDAITEAKKRGKDLYAMKPLGGGHLAKGIPEAIEFVRSLNVFDSICIGMKTPEEVEMNVQIFEQGYASDEVLQKVRFTSKKLIIYDSCKKCGNCEDTCDQKAIKVGEKKAEVNPERCILCGYCAEHCPVFAIRVI